ncbi:polyisoprenoid-binding protein [Iodidimonas muriae]|uniref:Polyisoprenoid-binding protein n=1 Tax=Iodidimonas muriae TaxID=261467 RepID=A0ABQ2LCB6_9PROT|nr:YceI family protein [Iodidimonas muriae]GER08034.1 polyisoprenoid-binding protein [Kordiimonadales bacterium JCM 17843]GGO09088.1 polyisoprenoid-binding protein [Iodidimonas muriae]
MTRLLIGLFFALVIPMGAQANIWQVIPKESQILWTAKWNTSPVHGGFSDFDATISFDMDHPELADLSVAVDIGSIYMDGQDARTTLMGDNWFFAESFPKAQFSSQDVRHLGNGRYEAHGTLEIRGVSQDLILPFKLTIEDDIARVEGGVTLDRTIFGLGKKGDVAKAVANGVNVSVLVTAKRAP